MEFRWGADEGANKNAVVGQTTRHRVSGLVQRTNRQHKQQERMQAQTQEVLVDQQSLFSGDSDKNEKEATSLAASLMKQVLLLQVRAGDAQVRTGDLQHC